MFKLNYLEVGPFRSFRDPQRIDFPENGMVLIQGINKDTGGSSGTGKSNLLLAIEYAYGSCPLPSTVLGSWFSDEPPTSKVGNLINGKNIELYRSKGLTIYENGKSLDKSAAQKEEYLEKEIGLSSEVRQALTYRGQKKPGLFLSQKTSSERSEFLVPLLDLDRFEQANEITDKNAKELITKYDAAKSSYLALQESLDSIKINDNFDELQLKLKEITTSISELDLQIKQVKENQENSRIKAESDAVAARDHYLKTNRYYDLKEQLETLQANQPVFIPDESRLTELINTFQECETRLKNLKDKEFARRKEHDLYIASLNRDIQQIAVKIGPEQSLKNEYNKNQKQLDILKQNKCHTCNREWLENQKEADKINARQATIEASLNAIEGLKLELIELQKKISGIPAFEENPNIAKLQKVRDDFSSKIGEEKQKIASAKTLHNAKFAKEIAEIKSNISKITLEANDRAQAIKSDWANNRNFIFINEIKGLEERRYKFQLQLNEINKEITIFETNKKQIDSLTKQIESKKTAAQEIETELNVENDLLHLLGREGFLGSIFDEVLDEISAETNNTLSQVANTKHITFEFKPEKITKKGVIKKEIVPVVTVNGHTGPINSVISGGQLSTVELAVDLAVGSVISRRTGVVPGYLILDESFVGLDPVSKESCFELLKIYAQERLILVIDHSTEFKSLFTKVITIEFKDGISTIIQDSV